MGNDASEQKTQLTQKGTRIEAGVQLCRGYSTHGFVLIQLNKKGEKRNKTLEVRFVG